MSNIRRYVLVPFDNCETDHEYDTFDEAQTAAVKWSEPVAIIARIYTYDDSELVWTSTGHDQWPPPQTATCKNCRQEIEYDKGNQPPWTHTADGLADCDHAYTGDDDEGSYAEPDDERN